MTHDALAWPPEYYRALAPDAPRFRFLDHNPGDRAVRQVLPRYLRPGAEVVDVGCGVAIGAAHLAAAGAERVGYTGVDPDREACARAWRVLASLPPERIRGRIVASPLDEYLATTPAAVDLVLCTFAFHECVDPEKPESHAPLAARIARLLRAGGVLIIGDPFFAAGVSTDEMQRTYTYLATITGHRDDGRFLPRELIPALFTGAGLSLREELEYPCPYLARYMGLPHSRYALRVFGKEPA